MNFQKHFQKIFLQEDQLKDILGQESVKQQLKSALLMNRHILIVGPPGIGKTTLAKNISKLLPEVTVNDCEYHCDPNSPFCPKCRKTKSKTKKLKGEERFIRIQGSPDLTAEDLLGDIDPIKAMKYGPLSLEAFTPGKIFKANNGILFFDEVNRCPEKLQNALLQVLEENTATIGSYDVDLEANFIFIGTMNPEDSSTEKLSDVFLDRFDIIYMHYPEDVETEKKIVKLKAQELVKFEDDLFHFMISFVRLLRESDKLEKLPSIRASIGLYERAQSHAFINNRTVSFADIAAVIISVLSHRISLKPSSKYLQSPEDFVKEQFNIYSDRFKELKEKKGGSL